MEQVRPSQLHLQYIQLLVLYQSLSDRDNIFQSRIVCKMFVLINLNITQVNMVMEK